MLVRIEVGYGLEGVVTDLQAAKIIRDILIPAFKSDDLMGGLTLASENIGALLLNGELPEDRGDYYSINPPIPLSLAVIILLAVLSYFIVFTDPSNLPRITLTGAIYGMVFLYVAEPGTMDQFNRCLRYVNAFCDRTTGYFLAYRQ